MKESISRMYRVRISETRVSNGGRGELGIHIPGLSNGSYAFAFRLIFMSLGRDLSSHGKTSKTVFLSRPLANRDTLL